MANYRITDRATRELLRIRKQLERDAGLRVAQYVEDNLFDGFDELARLPQIGHTRDGLGKPGELFHNVFQYAIVFRREPQVVILRVIHGARNLPRLI